MWPIFQFEYVVQLKNRETWRSIKIWWSIKNMRSFSTFRSIAGFPVQNLAIDQNLMIDKKYELIFNFSINRRFFSPLNFSNYSQLYCTIKSYQSENWPLPRKYNSSIKKNWPQIWLSYLMTDWKLTLKLRRSIVKSTKISNTHVTGQLFCVLVYSEKKY